MSLLLVLALVALNALFVAAELALVTVHRTRIEQLAAEGSRMARAVRAAMERPVIFIAGIQVGITAAGLVLGWVGEPAVGTLLDGLIRSLPGIETLVPPQVLGPLVTVISFFLITYFTITFGEIIPKSIALYRAEQVAMLVVPPVLYFVRLVRPLVALVNLSAQFVLRRFGIRATAVQPTILTEEEISRLIAEGRQAGVFRPQEEELVRRVFRFGDRVAREVMVPRTRVRAVEVDASLDQVLEVIRSTGFSRLPVYRENLDNIVGVLTVKDVLLAMSRQPRPASAAEIMRPAYYIPESKELAELLPELRVQETQLAVVLDEFGGTAGILTIEDLIEEVVGEIVSEYGTERRLILRQSDEELLVDAEMNISDLNELWDLSLPTEEVDTIGGFVYQQLGHIPIVGESFTYDGLTFSVRSMRGRTIGTVRIVRSARPAA